MNANEWATSTQCESSACVEVMWRTSNQCDANGGNCVEVGWVIRPNNEEDARDES